MKLVLFIGQEIEKAEHITIVNTDWKSSRVLLPKCKWKAKFSRERRTLLDKYIGHFVRLSFTTFLGNLLIPRSKKFSSFLTKNNLIFSSIKQYCYNLKASSPYVPDNFSFIGAFFLFGSSTAKYRYFSFYPKPARNNLNFMSYVY